MNNKSDEYSITIEEIVFLIKKNCKFILFWAVIFAMLSMTYKYISDKNDYNDYNVEHSFRLQNVDELLLNMTSDERNKLEYYESLKTEIERMKEKEENSIIMSIMEHSTYVFNMQVLINSISDVDNTNVVYLYENYINSGKLAEELEVALGNQYEAKYLQEVITAFVQKEDAKEPLQLLTVRVFGKDEVFCLEVGDAVKHLLQLYQERVDSVIGKSEVYFINEAIIETYSSDVQWYKQNFKNKLDALLLEETTKYEQLNDIQKYVIELKDKNIMEPPETFENVKLSWRSGIIGVFTGICFAIIFVIAKFLLSPCFTTVNEYGRIFNIKVINTFDTRNNVKNKIDEKEIVLCASKLEKICEKRGYNNITLCCDERILKENRFIEDITKSFHLQKISCNIVDNILTNSNAISELKKDKGIVFIEMNSKSRKKDFASKLSLCEQFGIEILGAIVIE